MITTLLLAAALAWSPPPHTTCHTYEEKAMHRWQSLCSDGTRAVSTYHATLGRWETIVTPPPGLTGKEKPRWR
jgi:hypothetical protein